MKKIVCELCDGNEFAKVDGMFVCQECGTKYSIEEARSMMCEVVEKDVQESSNIFIDTFISNSNQQQIYNILILATTAYEAHNYAETENYCNKVIELDVMCYGAWNLKGKAIGWQSKIDNLRIEEAAYSFCKAIDFAPEEKKEELKLQATDELKKLGIALISLRKDRFSVNPNAVELKGFSEDKKTVLNALLILLSHGNMVDIPEGYLEDVATLMNQAGVIALDTVRKVWNSSDHPGKKDWDNYIGWMSNIAEVFRQSISTNDKDEEDDVIRYKNLIIAIEEPIGSYSWTQKWLSYENKYKWFKEYSLSDSEIAYRKQEIQKYEHKIIELEEKFREEKQARIEAYWEVHMEEKVALEIEKKRLSEERADLHVEIIELDEQINATKIEENAKVVSEIEIDKLKEQIGELKNRGAKLGIFSGKEKKYIEKKIISFQSKIDSLKNNIDEERKVKAIEIQKKLALIQNRRDELSSKRVAVVKRISAIDVKLTKDPKN